MKSLILFIMLMLSGHLLAANVTREKNLSELGLTDDCEKASQLIKSGGLNPLQVMIDHQL